jgi:hypothetical protein
MLGVIKKGKKAPKAQDKNPKYYKKLADHHLFKLLSGNPHAIILSAPLIGTIKCKESKEKMKLIDLYQMLNSKKMHEIL